MLPKRLLNGRSGSPFKKKKRNIRYFSGMLLTFSYKACFVVLERLLYHAVMRQRKKESIYRIVNQLSILAGFNQSSRK